MTMKENDEPDNNKRSGPTTEAGRRKMEEAEAAREEKERRKREKNRKKTQAYREKQRMKRGRSPRRGRGAWTKSSDEKRKKDKTSSSDDDSRHESGAKKGKKRPWRQAKDKKRSIDAPTDESEWEREFVKALEKSDFDSMVFLFQVSLSWATKAGGSSSDDSSKRATKRFRGLSSRFHPDKHADKGEAANLYTVAFQALNHAYQELAVNN